VSKPIPQNKDGSYTIAIRVWKYPSAGYKHRSYWSIYLKHSKAFPYGTFAGDNKHLYVDDYNYLWNKIHALLEPVKQQKGDWNKWHKDMEEQLLYNPPRYSLLTKLKNKLRRK